MAISDMHLGEEFTIAVYLDNNCPLLLCSWLTLPRDNSWHNQREAMGTNLAYMTMLTRVV